MNRMIGLDMGIDMKLTLWQFVGFIFTAIAGVVLHFLYNWSNQSALVASFSAVNESIWEHMKLVYFPMFAFALIERQFIGDVYENFWCAKLVGILTSMLLIPVLYYSYTGIFGVELDWFNIAIFFLAALAGYLLETWLLKKNWICTFPLLCLLILCFIGFTFVVFTYAPPEIPLFQEP